MSQREFNDVLEDINFAEQRKYRQMGFTRGYSVGEEAGWRDGYTMGIRKGAQIAAEIGFYQGYVHAWISILEKEETNKQRKLTALRALLDMTRNFPKTNQIAENDVDDLNLRLSRIRAKFKQVSSLLSFETTATQLRRSFAASGGGGHTSFNTSQDGSYTGLGSQSGRASGLSSGSRTSSRGGLGGSQGGTGSGSTGGDHFSRSMSQEMSF